MNLNAHLKRGFFNFTDGLKDYNSYLAYCCAVGRVVIVLADCTRGGVVIISTMALDDNWPEVFLNELGLLAREHSALDGAKIDQFSIIEFETIEAAERFAFALVEWLKDCKGFESSLRRSYAAIQFVQSPESYSVGTAH